MIRFAEWLGHWSVDVYLLASLLLILTMLAMAGLRQPVHRLAVVKSLLIGLGLLAGLCAVPGWSILHLVAAKPVVNLETVRSSAPSASPAIAMPMTPANEALPANTAAISPPAPPSKSPSHLNIQAWTVVGVAELVGALGVAVWLACGWTIARSLRRGSYPPPHEVTQLLSQVAHTVSFKSNYVPRILASDRIDVPVALGLRCPVIALPSRMIAANPGYLVSQSDLTTVLGHELAHIRNGDLYWLAVSRGLLAFFWSHPLYWLARRRMRLDQESLADAAAAELTSREQYAEQLVGWARSLTNARTMRLASAVGLWEGASQLRQRVALLLDERITILRQFSRKWQLSTLGLWAILAASLSLITLRPGQGATSAEAPPLSPDNPRTPAYEIVTADGLHLPLAKPNQLSGKVVNGKHQPLADVEISIFRLRQSEATRKLVTTLKTDKNGEYRVENFIDLAKEFPGGEFPPPRDLGDEYLQIIARSPGYASQSQPESIQDVAQHGDSMPIILQPAVEVRGKVSDMDGRPIAGALVSLSNKGNPQNSPGASVAQTDYAGNYVITDASPFDLNAPKTFRDPALAGLDLVEVPPALTVSHPGYATKQVALAKAPATQDVSLERPATIEGSVVYGDSGKPATNVLVQARSEVHGPPVPVNGKLIPIVQTASVRTDANGRYKIETLPQGTYGLWAEANDWTNSGLVIHATSGEINHVFDLKLTRDGVISVRLVDADTGKSIPVEKQMTAMITASPIPYGTAAHAIMQPDISPTPEGRFELRSPPGKMAVSSVYMNDGIARHWLSRGTPIEVEVVEDQTVQIDLPVKAASAAEVAHNVDSVYAPANQPPAGPLKGVSSVPVAAPPGAVPVTIPASLPPVVAQQSNMNREKTELSTNHRETDQPMTAPAKTADVQFNVVIAKHALLLGGNELTTWEKLTAKVAALPDPSKAQFHFYSTNGALEAGDQQTLHDKIYALSKQFHLHGHSEGTLLPRTGARYDRIEKQSDLVPDPTLRVTGTVFYGKDQPVSGAEVVLITPVDESLPYKDFDIAMIEGRIRNPLDEVFTVSDEAGHFAIYPPKGAKYRLLAIHPNVGFNLTDDASLSSTPKIGLIPWAKLTCRLAAEDSSKQSVDLRTRPQNLPGYPDVSINQYWEDLKLGQSTDTFAFTHVPAILQTDIDRSFPERDGGSIGIPVVSVSLLPGEDRQIDLGPLSDKQREWLEFNQKQFSERSSSSAPSTTSDSQR